MIRSLRQPGPVHPSRIDSFPDNVQSLRFTLTQGATLNEAVTAPLVKAGFQCATVIFTKAGLNPFRYVVPGPADNQLHVAYFTAPRTPVGISRIEQANATFGWANDEPFIHCHAVWTGSNGQRLGGHILPHETIVAEPGEAIAWGVRSVRIDAKADPETNFMLFQPTAGKTTGRTIIARIKPNQDVIIAVETIAQKYGIRNAEVRGSLGSLIGASFTNGEQVTDHATEVLVRHGHVHDGKAVMDLLVIDMLGQVHEGWIQRGGNPVCITFELVLEDQSSSL